MTNGPGKSDRPTVPEKSPNNAGRVLSDRMRRLLTRWLPLPSVCHPYPLRRMGVVTSGKSRMRETRLSGSVEGVFCNRDPYSDYHVHGFGRAVLSFVFPFVGVD